MTSYELRISDGSSDVCSSDLVGGVARAFDLFTIEEAVILVAEVAGLLRESDLFGEARAEAVGARHDDAVLDPEFHEGVAAGADLRDEILVRHGDLAVLVAALFFVRDLIFDLERAGRSEERRVGKECVSTCRYGGAPVS